MRSVTRAALPWLSFGALALTSSAVMAAKPWPPREPTVEPKPAHQLRTPATWPAEPMLPAPIDPAKYTAAWAHICRVHPDSKIGALGVKILAAAEAAEVDPFTLAALAEQRSGCDPKFHKDSGWGLMGVDPGMYKGEGAPPLPVDKEMLTGKALRDPVTNLAVGAALLGMWEAKHKEIDESFGGVPHRGAIAHVYWGDEVRSTGHEDLVLTVRRRMVVKYNEGVDTPRPSLYGIHVVSPLEAPPRVATSGPGDDRDGGARRHRGLDIVAVIGEPVRAIADGTVIFAGVNMPSRTRTGSIPVAKIKRYRWRRLGVGGIYMCIEHTPDPKRTVSCYMHLNDYIVEERAEVKAGQIIGYVGRTGVKISPPHLHIEVRVDDRFTNPAKTLGDYVIPPAKTMTYLYNLKARRAKAKRLRAALDNRVYLGRG
jgi:hypothetical protein